MTEATIDLDTTLPIIRITREFDAPPARVFRAHAEPELVARWMGPRSMTTDVDHFECRTGGAYRYVQSDDSGSYAFFGSFHEVRPDELIVQTFTYEGFPDGVALEKLTFEALDGGRTRLVTVSQLDSFEGRDGLIASGMEVGVVEGYERLDELLDAQAS